MTSLIDLPPADVKMWYEKHIAYKNASNTRRAPLLLSFLVYTYRKVGYGLTMAMIEKETINEPMKRIMLLMTVKHWAGKPDYE